MGRCMSPILSLFSKKVRNIKNYTEIVTRFNEWTDGKVVSVKARLLNKKKHHSHLIMRTFTFQG